MADFNITILDSLTTSEFVDVLDNQTRKITVSDTTTVSENTDVLRAGARNTTVSDTTPVSDYIDIIVANARNVNVSDSTALLENVGFTTIQSPALIVRTISLTLDIPDTISFTVIKKGS